MTWWHIFFTADWATSTVQTVVVHLGLNSKSSAGLVEGYWMSIDSVHIMVYLCSPRVALSNVLGIQLAQCSGLPTIN